MFRSSRGVDVVSGSHTVEVYRQAQFSTELGHENLLAIKEEDSPLDQLCNVYIRALDDLSRLGPVYNYLLHDINRWCEHIKANLHYFDSFEDSSFGPSSRRLINPRLPCQHLINTSLSSCSRTLQLMCDGTSQALGHNQRELDHTMTLRAQLKMLIDWAQARNIESEHLLSSLKKDESAPLTEAQIQAFNRGQQFFSHTAFLSWIHRLLEKSPKDPASLA